MSGRPVIYARISDDAELTGLGVARQLADCRELAQRLGLSDPVEIVDNDVSAFDKRKKRPGWARLIELVRAGEATAIIAWHTDRLYRRLTDLEALATLLETHPVAIHTVSSGDLDLSTAAGRMTARILGSVAQHESEHKSERIVRAHAQIADAGRWRGGGPRPFGYLSDGVTIDPREAEVAREAARRILAGNSSTRVAEWASDVLGRRISQRSLLRSLTTPHIAGLRVYWPRIEREHWNAQRARGEVVGDEPAHLRLTHTRAAAWPAVLPEEDWRALVALYRSAPRPRPRRSLLAGVLRCGECDSPLGWGESKNAGVVSGVYATYRCVVSSGGCGRVSIGAQAVDDWISSLVRGAAGVNIERVQLAERAGRGATSERTRRALTTRLDELADAFGAGELTRDQHVRQRQRVLSELAALSAGDDQAIVKMRRREAAIEIIARWDSAERSERAAAIRALIPVAWVFRSGRGRSWPPECRVAPVWADDDRTPTKEGLRATLAAPPAPVTDAERKARRNARDRAKRQALRTRRNREQEATTKPAAMPGGDR